MIANRLDALLLLQDGILALARAERIGMRIDVDYCIKKKEHLTRKIKYLEAKFAQSNFYKHWKHVYGEKTNIDSGPQLSHLLYKIKKFEPAKTTTTGRGSTDEEALRQLNIPEINALIDISKLKKLKETYLSNILTEQVDGILHPFFDLHFARTYRSNSSHINFQNLPKRDYDAMLLVRRSILPRPGYLLLEADMSGAEVRTGCCYHNDPTMRKYIMDHTTDMHRDMAKQLFLLREFDKNIGSHYTLRQAAKNGFVFPEFYGDYYKNCAENLACTWGKLPKSRWNPGDGIDLMQGYSLGDHLITNNIKSFEQFIVHVQGVEHDFWNNRFKVYQEWKEDWWAAYQKKGYFDTLTGFRCSGVFKFNDVINYPVQGSSFHILLKAFIEVDRIIQKEKLLSRLIGQIHDSMVLDAHPSEKDYLIEIINRVICVSIPNMWKWITVPMEVDFEMCEVDEPWSAKKAIKI